MAKLIGGVAFLIGFLVLTVALGFLFAYPTMWLVNYLFSNALLLYVFGVSKITVWQAWALNVICGTLFKSTNTSAK